jgi:hypothetical protein
MVDFTEPAMRHYCRAHVAPRRKLRMETWKECGWGKCGKRFEPARRGNQHHRTDGRRHEGAIYCSRACRQKAYLWRLEASRALCSTLKVLMNLGRKSSMLAHLWGCKVGAQLHYL